MAKQAKKAARAPNSDPNILIVAQAGRLTYEAVLFVASLRAHAPGFAGRVLVAERGWDLRRRS